MKVQRFSRRMFLPSILIWQLLFVLVCYFCNNIIVFHSPPYINYHLTYEHWVWLVNEYSPPPYAKSAIAFCTIISLIFTIAFIFSIITICILEKKRNVTIKAVISLILYFLLIIAIHLFIDSLIDDKLLYMNLFPTESLSIISVGFISPYLKNSLHTR